MSMDFSAIVEQLEADPGFRARLRAVVLSDELLEVPGQLARLEGRLVETDVRLAERVDALAAVTATLAERVDALAAVTATLAERVDALATVTATLAERVDALATVTATLAERVDLMEARLGSVEDGVASLKGSHFEEQVARHPGRYLAAVLHRPKARPVESFDLDALEPDEVRRLVRVDATVSGLPARRSSQSASGIEVLAAVEVSWRVHRDDLDRARDRAALLARAAGSPVLPVALSKLDPGGAVIEAAEELGVELVVDDGELPRSQGRALAPAS